MSEKDNLMESIAEKEDEIKAQAIEKMVSSLYKNGYYHGMVDMAKTLKESINLTYKEDENISVNVINRVLDQSIEKVSKVLTASENEVLKKYREEKNENEESDN